LGEGLGEGLGLGLSGGAGKFVKDAELERHAGLPRDAIARSGRMVYRLAFRRAGTAFGERG
jgi:hypothetical protein